jgi:hypothetical protein
VTALKLTKRAKIAGLASMALAATSLTVMFVSNSALASTAPKGGTPPATATPGGAAVTTDLAFAHLHLPGDADGHTDHGDAAADHSCADADADADVDAVRSGASGGDRLPASDGLTCRKPITAGERAAG